MRILKHLVVVLLIGFASGKQTFAQASIDRFSCEDPFSLCTERQYNRSLDPEYKGRYIGHDEPALLFYSNVNGSGNNYVSKLVLPTDPSTFPTDANPTGTGGPTVWNFQLHPTFWYGMALCDSESFPLSRTGARPIPTTTFSIAEIHIRRATSAATREPLSWNCSSIRRVG